MLVSGGLEGAPPERRTTSRVEEHEESADIATQLIVSEEIGVGSHPLDRTSLQRGFVHLIRRPGVRGQVGGGLRRRTINLAAVDAEH